MYRTNSLPITGSRLPELIQLIRLSEICPDVKLTGIMLKEKLEVEEEE